MLELAERWGCPPWQIADGSAGWLLQQIELDRIRGMAEEAKRIRHG